MELSVDWPESCMSLWDRALKATSSALLELVRTSSDVEVGSEKAPRLEEVSTGGFNSRVKDEVVGLEGVECVTFENLIAGEAGATTAGTAGLSDVFSLPLVVVLGTPMDVLDVIAS